jgi:hypothetical protein
VSITLVTPEEAPLAIFGTRASDAVKRLLEDYRIRTITSAYGETPRPGFVSIHPGPRELHVNRVVALPELFGPCTPGVPKSAAAARVCYEQGSLRVFGPGASAWCSAAASALLALEFQDPLDRQMATLSLRCEQSSNPGSTLIALAQVLEGLERSARIGVGSLCVYLTVHGTNVNGQRPLVIEGTPRLRWVVTRLCRVLRRGY